MTLDEVIGKATENVCAAIQRGDVPTSRWLLDRVASVARPMRFIIGDGGPADQARQLLHAVRKGGLSLDDADRLLRMIERVAMLKGMDDLEELRQQVAELSQARSTDRPGHQLHPAWLRLAAQAPKVPPVSAARATNRKPSSKPRNS